MASSGRLRIGVLTLLVLAACTPQPLQVTLDEGLSTALPSASELPVELFGLGDSPPVFEYLGPDAGEMEFEGRGVFTAREGPRGGRAIIVGDDREGVDDPASTDPIVSVSLVLYEHSDDQSARGAWVNDPPELAYRDFRMNTELSDEEIERQLPDWRFDVGGRDDYDWQGVCLTGALGGRTECSGFEGWVRFCRWTMSITIGVKSWELADPRVPQIMEALAKQTAHNLNCSS